MKYKKIDLKKIVGKGYRDIWNFKGRYKVIKGSRASKKSKTTALWIIYNMMKYKDSNTLIVRKVFRTIKDSCFSDLKWACQMLQVENFWKFTNSPLEATYLPTGQKILFRGLDDALKITSISVDKGFLCWVWFEECYEIMSEDSFQTVIESIRGELPKPLFYQFILTLNPWSDKHWVKKRFFDNKDKDVLAVTTTYKCNEFLNKEYIKDLEKLKITNPKRYKVAGLGEWGIVDGLVYENWQELDFDYKALIHQEGYILKCGLDFGYAQDPTAFIACLVNEENKEIFIYDEFSKKGMVNKEIANMIKYKGYNKEQIIADSSEPKSIEEIKREGITRITGAIKGQDSVLYGIQKLQQYKIYVHPDCVNTITEFSLYCWDKKNDEMINKPVDMNNHLLDALRYAIASNDKQRGINTKRKIIY